MFLLNKINKTSGLSTLGLGVGIWLEYKLVLTVIVLLTLSIAVISPSWVAALWLTLKPIFATAIIA